MDEKEVKKVSLKNEKLKANRASETEEQRKERLRIRVKKRRRTKKVQQEREKVVRNRRPPETMKMIGVKTTTGEGCR